MGYVLVKPTVKPETETKAITPTIDDDNIDKHGSINSYGGYEKGETNEEEILVRENVLITLGSYPVTMLV